MSPLEELQSGNLVVPPHLRDKMTSPLTQLMSDRVRGAATFIPRLMQTIQQNPVGLGLSRSDYTDVPGQEPQNPSVGMATDLAMNMVGAPMFTTNAATLGSGAVRRLPVRASPNDPYEALDATFKYGAVGKNKTLPIDKVSGIYPSGHESRVADLIATMRGPEGYISRLLVDDAGNVVEGQHRLAALRELGATKVPVTELRDLSRGIDVNKMEAAVRAVGGLHPDQVKGVVQGALEAIASGNPRGMELPGFQKYFDAAINSVYPVNPVNSVKSVLRPDTTAPLPSTAKSGIGGPSAEGFTLGSGSTDKRTAAMVQGLRAPEALSGEILPPATSTALPGVTDIQRRKLGPMLEQLEKMGATPEQIRTFTPVEAYKFIRDRQL